MNRHTYSLPIVISMIVIGCSSGTSPPPVTVYVTSDQMATIESLPDDLACFTSAENPISSLEGIGNDEFASWVTSPSVPQKLMAAFGRADSPVGLRIVGTGNDGAKFNKSPNLRLFITHEPYSDDILAGGGMRIVFKTK